MSDKRMRNTANLRKDIRIYAILSEGKHNNNKYYWLHNPPAVRLMLQLGLPLGPLSARSHLDSQLLLSFVERVLMGVSSTPRS